MEPVEETHFEWIHFTPDIDEGTVRIDYELSLQSALPCIVEIAISFQNDLIFCGRMIAKDYPADYNSRCISKESAEWVVPFYRRLLVSGNAESV